MTELALRPAEITGAVAALSRLDPRLEITDPFEWHDIVFAKDETASVIERRTRDRFGPRWVDLFPWPKESGGHRLFTIIDPFDRIVFHAASGRLAGPIAAAHSSSVTSFDLQVGNPGYRWSLTSGKELYKRRVALGKGLLGSPPSRVLVTADIRSHFGSVSVDALSSVLSDLWIDDRLATATLQWLTDYQQIHDGQGLPLGHDGSRLLGHAILTPVDEHLAEEGISFVRWVDDYWLVVEACDVGQSLDALAAAVQLVDLQLNDAKTNSYVDSDALRQIENLAIASTIDRERTTGDHAAVVDLFSHAVEAPSERGSELRWSLGALARRCDPVAAIDLLETPEAFDVAHQAAVHYFTTLAGNPKTRASVDLDALVDLATDRATVREHPYRSLGAAKILASCDVGKARAAQLRDLATGEASVLTPLRTWAVKAAHRSRRFSGRAAVDGVLSSAGVDVKRAFALTLANSIDQQSLTAWTDRLLRDEQDLAPTVAWLRAGAPVP